MWFNHCQSLILAKMLPVKAATKNGSMGQVAYVQAAAVNVLQALSGQLVIALAPVEPVEPVTAGIDSISTRGSH